MHWFLMDANNAGGGSATEQQATAASGGSAADGASTEQVTGTPQAAPADNTTQQEPTTQQAAPQFDKGAADKVVQRAKEIPGLADYLVDNLRPAAANNDSDRMTALELKYARSEAYRRHGVTDTELAEYPSLLDGKTAEEIESRVAEFRKLRPTSEGQRSSQSADGAAHQQATGATPPPPAQVPGMNGQSPAQPLSLAQLRERAETQARQSQRTS